MASYNQEEDLQSRISHVKGQKYRVFPTLENVQCRVELKILSSLIQERHCPAGLEWHRQQALLSQIMRHFSADCDR